LQKQGIERRRVVAGIRVLTVERPMTLRELINVVMSRPLDCEKVPKRLLAARSVWVNGVPRMEGAESEIIDAGKPQILELGTLMWAIKRR